jgi:hypothetical protein
MDVSKRGEEMLVSGSDDGYIGVSATVFHYGAFLTLDRSGTLEPKTPSHSSLPTSP